MDEKKKWRVDEIGNRREVLDDVERQLLVDGHIGGEVADRAQQDRVAVGRGLGGEFQRNDPVGARAVVDDERLLEAFAHFLGDGPHDEIRISASRRRDDHANWPDRVVLCNNSRNSEKPTQGHG